MLRRRDFVVLGLGQNSKLPKLLVQVLHKGLDARLYHAKVMVFKLLAFWGFGSEQSAARVNQVFALFINALVNQKIFLLWADGRLYACDRFVSVKQF